MGFKKHHQVNIFLEPGSKLCELTKEYFRAQGIQYDEFNVSKDIPAMRRLIDISGQEKVPTVEFDGRVILGYRPEVYDILLADKEPPGA